MEVISEFAGGAGGRGLERKRGVVLGGEKIFVSDFISPRNQVQKGPKTQ